MSEQDERRSPTIDKELTEWSRLETEMVIARSQRQQQKLQPARNWFHLIVLMTPIIITSGIAVWSWRLALFGLGLELWSFGNHASVHHIGTIYAKWWFRWILGLGTWLLSIVLLVCFGL